jgi:hypothetical protein
MVVVVRCGRGRSGQIVVVVVVGCLAESGGELPCLGASAAHC